MLGRSLRIGSRGSVGGLVLLAATGLAPAASADPAATPRIEVEPPAIDFGQVVRGSRHEVEFTVRNTGGAPLRIFEARPG